MRICRWLSLAETGNLLAGYSLGLLPASQREAEMTLSVQSTIADHSATSAFEVIPTGAPLAAEVRGVDLRYLDDRTFGRLMDVWHQHSVLQVRGQSLSDQELIAFSRRFGDLDWAPIQENGRRFVEGLPEIYIVSNVKV